MRVAMAQLLVHGGEPARNLAAAARMVRRAALEACRLVVLPECLDYGWTHPAALHGHFDTLARLQHQAAANSIHLAAGFVERAGNRLFNAAVLIAPSGQVLLHHRKLNELALAAPLYSPGSSLAVADTAFGRAGLLICADLFPTTLEYARALARMRAQWILSPSAWAVEAHHDNTLEPYGALWLGAYRAVTRDFPLTIVGVSNVGWLSAGPWAGRKCIGCSLAIGPNGQLLAQAPYGPDAEHLAIFEAPLHPPPPPYSPANPIPLA
jgi:predicted amidohydrolase